MNALLAAVDVLNDRLIAADAIAKALDLAGDGDPPPWVYVFRDQIEGINTAAERVESLVRGIGGVAPDVAKRNGMEDGGADLAFAAEQGASACTPCPACPEKPDVLNPQDPVFLSSAEKSSVKSTR